MRQHFNLIQPILANYKPNNNPAAKAAGDGYRCVFEETFCTYFEDETEVAHFSHYLHILGPNLTETVFEKFLIRLLNRLSDKSSLEQVNEQTVDSIKEAINAELEVDKVTTAQKELLLLSYSTEPEINENYSYVFEKQVNTFFSDPAQKNKFAKYLQDNANAINTTPFVDETNEEPNPLLVTRFIHNVLARMIAKRETVNVLKIEVEAILVIHAINDELGWYGKFHKENKPEHVRDEPVTPFDVKEYFVEKVLLGCSSYFMDDFVTAVDRPFKNIAYASGDPNYDFSKASGSTKIANDGHTNLMFLYFGVTAASFLIVPLRCIYIAATVGWEDKIINGKKKIGLKNTLRDRDTIVEFAINVVIVTLTGLAVFATTFIVWPVVISMFTVGLFAAVYTAVVTKKGAKENLEKLALNNTRLKELGQKVEKNKQLLNAELNNPIAFARISEEIHTDTALLEQIHAENHNLVINQEYNNSFFGKYGVYMKVGISTATVIAYTLLATAIFTASAVFLPSLIVMSVLSAAALTYFIVKQYNAYQQEKKKHAGHTTCDDHVDTLVTNSQKGIFSALKVRFRVGNQAKNNLRVNAEEVQPLLAESSSPGNSPRLEKLGHARRVSNSDLYAPRPKDQFTQTATATYIKI